MINSIKDLTEDQLNKIWELNAEGLTAGKIAQKTQIKKVFIQEVIGSADNTGLGTKIEAFTEATGIKAVVDALVDDCGCKARAAKLNKIFPNRKLNDLTLADNEYLTNFFSKKVTSVSMHVQKELVAIFNSVFNSKRTVSNCGVCVAKMIEDLRLIYIEANKE